MTSERTDFHIAGEVLHIVEPVDNVATALAELSAGSTVRTRDAQGNEQPLALREAIPFGHKVALVDLPAGAPVVKYGLPIGRASQPILAGAWVHVHNLVSQRACAGGPQGLALPQDWQPPTELSQSDTAGLTFEGYWRSNGLVGIRNHLLVISTVVCANSVAEKIAASVPGALALTHPLGCSQLDAERVRHTLHGLARHPNAGAVLAVGLGCEMIRADALAGAATEAGKPADFLVIQEAGGETRGIAKGTRQLEGLAKAASLASRAPCPLASLRLATECGGSDATSGLIANPLIGLVADRLAGAGASVVLAETTELMGAEPYLFRRARSRQTAERIAAIVGTVEAEAQRLGIDLRGAQPTPGNIAGGLSTIEEKSLGCIHKAGSALIESVVEYAISPQGAGLHIMDTPGQDAESLTGLAAGGCQIALFSTGRGTPLGNPLMPVIKLTANPHTAHSMGEHIDFSAAAALDGSATLVDLAEKLFHLLLQVAGGRLTRAEILGHREMAITRAGPTI